MGDPLHQAGRRCRMRAVGQDRDVPMPRSGEESAFAFPAPHRHHSPENSPAEPIFNVIPAIFF
jgi:hypothetical protein